MKCLLSILMLMGFACVLYAANGSTTCSHYKAIIDDLRKTVEERDREGQAYLMSLDKASFMDFVREVDLQNGTNNPNAGYMLAMNMFVHSYLAGPGKDELFECTLQQLLNPTLPLAWKVGLLGVMRPQNRADLTDTQVTAVVSTLMNIAQDNIQADAYRVICLNKLGSFLVTQRDLLVRKDHELEDAIDKQDTTILPKRDNVNQAAKLIATITDYKKALQRTIGEVKDDKNIDSLRKCLIKWQPVSLHSQN